jgi:cytochrome P450
VLTWIARPLAALEAHGARYGDVFRMKLPGAPDDLVIVSNPAAIKDVFSLGPDEAHAGEANLILEPVVGRHSILVMDGSSHLRHRKMMMPPFHGERMTAYGRTMIDIAEHAVDDMPVGKVFPVHEPMQKVTLDIILRTVFGIDQGPRFKELADLLTKALAIAVKPGVLFVTLLQKDLGPLSPWGKFKRLMSRVREILVAEMRRGREKGTAGRTDVLAMMLDAKDESGAPLTEDELHDELITLLVAGHETTATALAWAFRNLLADDALYARVRTEAEATGGDVGKIAKSELLEGVVKETLRLQPVIPMVGRILNTPMNVLGWDIPAGTAVVPAIHLVHRRPALYPDPTRFDPDRYRTWKPAPSEWLPFGGGLRRCLGAAFATFEMKMVLATVLPRVEMRLATKKVKMARRGITLTPAGGLPVVVTRKVPARTHETQKIAASGWQNGAEQSRFGPP